VYTRVHMFTTAIAGGGEEGMSREQDMARTSCKLDAKDDDDECQWLPARQDEDLVRVACMSAALNLHGHYLNIELCSTCSKEGRNKT
jgi:hypothetical protein